MTKALLIGSTNVLTAELAHALSAYYDSEPDVVIIEKTSGTPFPIPHKRIYGASIRTLYNLIDEFDSTHILISSPISNILYLSVEALRLGIIDAREALSFSLLVGMMQNIANDLESRGISILHPHQFGEQFKLTAMDISDYFEVNDATRDLANKLRLGMAFLPERRLRLPEAQLYGVTAHNELRLIRTETIGTDRLIRSLSPKVTSKYERTILLKRTRDDTHLSLSVLGPKTIESCVSRGITDIALTEECIIQGKNEFLQSARDNNIRIIALG